MRSTGPSRMYPVPPCIWTAKSARLPTRRRNACRGVSTSTTDGTQRDTSMISRNRPCSSRHAGPARRGEADASDLNAPVGGRRRTPTRCFSFSEAAASRPHIWKLKRTKSAAATGGGACGVNIGSRVIELVSPTRVGCRSAPSDIGPLVSRSVVFGFDPGLGGVGNDRGAPVLGAPLSCEGGVQRLWCTLVSTCGTLTCGRMSSSHTRWSMPVGMSVTDANTVGESPAETAAGAGAARPRMAATSPLAAMVANPNFSLWCLSSFCLLCCSSRGAKVAVRTLCHRR